MCLFGFSTALGAKVLAARKLLYALMTKEDKALEFSIAFGHSWTKHGYEALL